MRQGPLAAVVEHLHHAVEPATTDAELLRRFVRDRDATAFELLLRRHERLVMAVCRGVLHDGHAAEDAFQATFLILARRAVSIGRGGLAGWLHRVALRTSLRARVRGLHRQARERSCARSEVVEPSADATWRDLRPILDAELDALPEKYRIAFILCHIQDKRHDEAAVELGCARSTVAVWLSRGRAILRRRLVRRGVTLSVGLLAGREAVAAGLTERTLTAALEFAAGGVGDRVAAPAAGLAKGVMHAMFLDKIKILTAAVLAVVVVALGVGSLMYRAEAVGEPFNPPAAAAEEGSPKQIQLSLVVAEVEAAALPLLGLKVVAADAAAASQVLTAAETHRFNEALKVLLTLNHAKVLSEPRLVTTDGREASFLSGGQVPLPATSHGSAGGVRFEDFGTHLRVRPTITGGQIDLELEAELSELTGGPVLRGAGQELRLYSDGGVAGSLPVGKDSRKFRANTRLVPGTTLAVTGAPAKEGRKVPVLLVTLEVVSPPFAPPVSRPAPSASPQPFDALVADLAKNPRGDEQAVEALVLAVLGRFPTDTEKSLLGDTIGGAKDRRDGLTRLVQRLTATKEFRDHAAALAEQAKLITHP